MTTHTISVPQTKTNTGLTAALFAAVFGFAIIAMVGMVQSETLHDAAHDVRHATGFPCH